MSINDKHLIPENITNVKAYYNQNYSVAQIERLTGISSYYIRKIIAKNPALRLTSINDKISDQEKIINTQYVTDDGYITTHAIEEIRTDYIKGTSKAKLSKKTGISIHYINKILYGDTNIRIKKQLMDTKQIQSIIIDNKQSDHIQTNNKSVENK